MERNHVFLFSTMSFDYYEVEGSLVMLFPLCAFMSNVVFGSLNLGILMHVL